MIFYEEGGDLYMDKTIIEMHMTIDRLKNIEECLNKQISFQRKITVAILLAGTYAIYKKIRSRQNND